MVGCQFGSGGKKNGKCQSRPFLQELKDTMYPLQLENGWYIEKLGDVEEELSWQMDDVGHDRSSTARSVTCCRSLP